MKPINYKIIVQMIKKPNSESIATKSSLLFIYHSFHTRPHPPYNVVWTSEFSTNEVEILTLECLKVSNLWLFTLFIENRQ